MASQLDHRILMKDIMFMVGHAEMSVAAVGPVGSVVELTRWAVLACKQLATQLGWKQSSGTFLGLL